MIGEVNHLGDVEEVDAAGDLLADVDRLWDFRESTTLGSQWRCTGSCSGLWSIETPSLRSFAEIKSSKSPGTAVLLCCGRRAFGRSRSELREKFRGEPIRSVQTSLTTSQTGAVAPALLGAELTN